MSETHKHVERFGRMYAWANRILRIDLSSLQIEVQPAAPYVPSHLGGRGIAARLCWEERPVPVGPFAPANPLTVFPGVLSGVEGIGELEGPSIEYHLFAAGTGVGWSEGDFERAAARVCALERALQVRHWGRDRAMDESVLPCFEQVELYQSAYHEARYALGRERFRPVLDAFYALHGWDRERGWPTRARLAELGVPELYAPMLRGASRAQTALGKGRESAPLGRQGGQE